MANQHKQRDMDLPVLSRTQMVHTLRALKSKAVPLTFIERAHWKTLFTLVETIYETRAEQVTHCTNVELYFFTSRVLYDLQQCLLTPEALRIAGVGSDAPQARAYLPANIDPGDQ